MGLILTVSKLELVLFMEPVMTKSANIHLFTGLQGRIQDFRKWGSNVQKGVRLRNCSLLKFSIKIKYM